MHSSLIVLVVAGALVGATQVLFAVPVEGVVYVAALAGAWLVYLAERLVPAPEDARNHPARTRWLRRHRRALLTLCGISTVAGLWAAAHLSTATQVGGVVLLLCSGIYALPMVQGRRLKTVAVAKPLLIAVGWGGATVVLPLAHAGVPIGASVLALGMVRMLTVAVNVLLHDWAQRGGDRLAGAATLPPAWRWPHLRWVVGSLLACALILEGLLYFSLGALVLVDAAGLLLFALVLWHEPQGGWREELLLDALVAWPLVTVLAAWMGVVG